MRPIVERYVNQRNQLTVEQYQAVKQFAEALTALLKQANPARFTNGRGKLLYVKLDCDPELEIEKLLGVEEDEQE